MSKLDFLCQEVAELLDYDAENNRNRKAQASSTTGFKGSRYTKLVASIKPRYALTEKHNRLAISKRLRKQRRRTKQQQRNIMANSHDSTEPVAWRIPVSIKHHNGTVTHTHQFRAEKASSLDEPLYAAPPAQQPQEEHLTVTWDEQQTRIFAVTMQDEEGRILKVLAEAPAQQPQAEWIDGVPHWTPDLIAKVKRMAAELDEPKEPQAEVGNSGFDHKTASDFLSGKTVSDEAVRKFAQASRWAHDDRASLQSMLLSVRNELASREAEIALLKKELMGAEESPQQAEAVPSEAAVVAGARVLNQRAAEACGVNADDQWAIYAEAFKDDVRAVLAAAQGEKP